MPESGKDDREHFIKQRRNLVLISLIVTFYYTADLTFEEFNVLGNKVKVDQPELVSLWLIVFFVYFLLRYYTACRAVAGINSFYYSCKTWFEERCVKQVSSTLRKSNITIFGQPHVSYSSLLEVCVYFDTSGGYNADIHGPKFKGKLINDKLVSYGPKFLPLRLYSIIYSIVNHKAFFEYVVPYILAFAAILEICGYGLVGWLQNIILSKELTSH